MGAELAHCAGISAEVLSESESDRTALEVHAQKGHRHALLSNEGEVPRSDPQLLHQYSAVPSGVTEFANSELSHCLIFALPFGASILGCPPHKRRDGEWYEKTPYTRAS